jgi:hypothetical protein
MPRAHTAQHPGQLILKNDILTGLGLSTTGSLSERNFFSFQVFVEE